MIEEKVSKNPIKTIPKFVPPSSAVIANSPTTFVNYHRVRIDPERAENIDQVIVFYFKEKGKAGLHIRRGIAEFLTEPDTHYHAPDIIVSMGGESLADLYVNLTDLTALVDAGKAKMTKGEL